MENSLLETIREDVVLIAIGKNFVGLCPFHDEKTPSFEVSPIRRVFECFGCGKKGGIEEYLEFRNERRVTVTAPVEGPIPNIEMEKVYRRNRQPFERNVKF